MKRAGLALVLALTACAGNAPKPDTAAPLAAAERMAVPVPISSAVNASDRAQADRDLDAGRHPAELLAYYQVAPGQKIGELFAGGGYTAEMLSRVVGPEGKVYGVNSPMVLERFAEKPWAERLSKPLMSNVVRLDRAFDDPFPADVKDLDRVFSILVYHDFVWMGINRDAMNTAIFNSLKSGGIYAVVDHSAKAGSGIQDVQTFHRIEQQVVRAEVEKAGFIYKGEADFLRNPEDTRDWNDSPRVAAERRGTSDRFAMLFVKP